jgi:hypothetical protein
MAPRLELHTILVGLLGNGNVYFQPPSTVQMKYPCIVYGRDDAETDFADNRPYGVKVRYKVTVIDRDPDSEIPMKVAMLPTCTFVTWFTVDKLNHDVYQLFF